MVYIRVSRCRLSKEAFEGNSRKLKPKNKYHFNFSNGLKNRNLYKWRYMPDWSNWRNEKENVKKICINMYNAIR